MVKVFVEDFKGQKIFGIYEVDPNTGEKIKPYPELSFGGKKAAVLLDNVKELEKFVHDWRSNYRDKK